MGRQPLAWKRRKSCAVHDRPAGSNLLRRIVRAATGSVADLLVGEYVFIGAQATNDGSSSAGPVQVSNCGLKPPL
ncbi:MAG: hypothetical protein ACREYD_07220 [Casimicrobiaceae bacterium]